MSRLASTRDRDDEVGAENKRPALPQLRKVQFTVDAGTVEKLEESRRLNRDSSLVQSFRRAAALLSFFDKMRKEGFEVILRKGDEVYKIFIPE